MKGVLHELRKPQTGKPADDAEVKTVDSLTDLINLINEQAQRANSQPSPGENGSAEEMQFLLQMARNAGKCKIFRRSAQSRVDESGRVSQPRRRPTFGQRHWQRRTRPRRQPGGGPD